MPRTLPYGWRLALVVLTMLRLVVAARTPISPDEAYYWVWSHALAPGYLDHPPMVALWIRIGTTIVGDSALGVRLLGPVSALLGSLLLARAAQDLAPGRQAGLVAACLLNATLALNAGAVIMTPDTPLLFFWTATLCALGRLLRTGRGHWWLLAGVAGGLALDSKYTGFLLALSVLVWLLTTRAARPWLRAWQLWAACALALALFAPVLGWNAAHGWVSFVKQGGRTGDFHLAHAARFLSELILGQLGMATPWVALLFGAGTLAALRARAAPGPALLACVTLLPAAIFIEHALGDRVQANWPAILYPGAAIAAAWAGARHWRPAAALGLAMSLAVFLQAAAGPFTLPRRLDFTLARLAGWSDLAGRIYVIEHAQKADFVAADNYGLASELAFHLRGEVVGVEPRWQYFTLPPARLDGRIGLLIRPARETNPPDSQRWASITALGTLSRGRDGEVAEIYRVYRVVGRGDGGVMLPVTPREDEKKALLF